ncbi:uncharacterized protein ASCRUDRAFT_103086 [Ascoidea rubescens DSM 1968]|uniref:Uncharacterized protein n=1 Tax=Ascoidea rubescens DSM 1968 TaxID=1344418 RepID=A0A1D2VRF4_9ASCO|nr:hypothetical protein ASCRUDRAFT_103086 [Ascoidea rubescens DSM 1968]ODV64158.1 hypothetical protein ASCRUDRAFT_103086 [Ascoidea rubescens DSM 1968]
MLSVCALSLLFCCFCSVFALFSLCFCQNSLLLLNIASQHQPSQVLRSLCSFAQFVAICFVFASCFLLLLVFYWWPIVFPRLFVSSLIPSV